MKSGRNYWNIIAVSLSLLLIMATGCSNLSPLGSNQTSSSAGTTSDYPPITEDLLINGPVPGSQIVRIQSPSGSMSVDNWDYAEAWIWHDRGGEVFTAQGTGCIISIEALPIDTLITVTLPVEGYAIVDFGPHPLQFNREIIIALSLDGTGYVQVGMDDPKNPKGSHERTIEDLNVYYYNEATGRYELYPNQYDPERNAFMCRTDHFSRYIIA